MRTVTIGIDIGGSSVKAVARDEMGRILARHEAPAVATDGSGLVATALAAVRALEVVGCAAVGVGVPGQVDPRSGEVTMAVNLDIGSEPVPLAEELEAALGLPVTIDNDVRAAALGAHESLRLRGDTPSSLVLVSIGTGISAGLVVDGVVLRGSSGMAGEIGHVVVDDSGALCRCGQRGCLETVAAGPAIAKAWPNSAAGEAATSLFAAAAAGDPGAVAIAGGVAHHLTTALIWLAATYDAACVVLAGGVSGAGDAFLGSVREHIARRGALSELAARRLRPEQVTLADADDPPGPRGAALLAAEGLPRREMKPTTSKVGNDA